MAAYSGSLDGAFVYDDRPSIVDNEAIRDLAAYVAGGAGARPSRYLGYLTFALNYHLGGLDVTGYHLVNLAIHLANALLVYALVRLTLRTPALARSPLAGSAPAVAFVAAALFVAHPMAVQAVTYVVQRLTSLATTFYLAALVAYARWRLAPTTADGDAKTRRGAWYGFAILSAVAAMNTKEITFTLPLCVLLYERSFFGRLDLRRWLTLAPLVATLAIVPLVRMQAVTAGGGTGSGVGALLEGATRVQSEVSRWDYARTQLAVLVTYLRLLVFPVGQNFDHDHPTYTSLLELRVAGSAALLAALAALAAFLFRKGEREGTARLAAFGIGWFFLTASVESSILPIADVISEHRAYLPSVGFFLAVAVGAASLARRLRPEGWARHLAVAALALASILAVATFRRSEVWASEITLWSDVVAKSPRRARGHESLGTALGDAGRHEEAVRELTIAIRLDPGRPEPYYNLGRVLLAAGTRTEDAAALLSRAVAMRPDWPEAHANLAAALNALGRFPETIGLLERAPAGVAASAEARFNLAVAYAAVGDVPRARAELATLRRLSPELAARLDAFIHR
jgi:Flp pilus assembly protein TadD